MMHLMLISGLSGSGKSIALNVLADGGYYCVDNLPATLLPETVRLLEQSGYTHAAISIDVRSGESFSQLPRIIAELKQGVDLRILFLEAKLNTLVKRFSETRRRHPLSSGGRSLPECIQLERELLANVGDIAQRIDTSDLSPNTLRAWIKDISALERTSGLTLLFQSFGFKHGIPLDADMVYDVRCLPNPHYDPKLRALTGKDAAVISFLEQDESVGSMLEDIRAYIEKWLPCFIRDNRNYLTVAIGCTGGQHRSVYFAEKLGQFFHPQQQVVVRHREMS